MTAGSDDEPPRNSAGISQNRTILEILILRRDIMPRIESQKKPLASTIDRVGREGAKKSGIKECGISALRPQVRGRTRKPGLHVVGTLGTFSEKDDEKKESCENDDPANDRGPGCHLRSFFCHLPSPPFSVDLPTPISSNTGALRARPCCPRSHEERRATRSPSPDRDSRRQPSPDIFCRLPRDGRSCR